MESPDTTRSATTRSATTRSATTRSATSALDWRATLDDITFPAEAVVVADGGLPDALLARLPEPIYVEAGESLKTLDAIGELAGRVLARRASRPMTVVAVGGGSVGDAVGFLASVLWRGVALWHVPTTLLAMVDSAHGGKTALNLGAHKNQLGTFHVAERVVLVEEILAGLHPTRREGGLVELVKALWLGDPDALTRLEEGGGVAELASAPHDAVAERLRELVTRAVEVKRAIVDRDPRETRGVRTVLNLGHTVAHALELHAGLAHGHAVAWGMLAAGRVSVERAGLALDDLLRLRGHLFALQAPLDLEGAFGTGDLESAGERDSALEVPEDFAEALRRDKKRRDGLLRSVVLRGPGDPEVVETLGARDWWRALCSEWRRWKTTPLHVHFDGARSASVELSSSKSEMNRLLVIAHLRRGDTHIEGRSAADDVRAMERALAVLAATPRDETARIDACEGGTTLRFLMAAAALRPGRTIITCRPSLWRRPHGQLFAALRAAGVAVEDLPDPEVGWSVRGVSDASELPARLRVDASVSSQHASALCLMAAGSARFELELVDADGEPLAAEEQMVSRPYLSLTLELLREAGVQWSWSENIISLAPTDRLGEPIVLRADADASSAAVWETANFLGARVTEHAPCLRGLQPDLHIQNHLARLTPDTVGRPDDSRDGDSLSFHLVHAPDLAPVLTAASVLSHEAVRLGGIEHVRTKESNRIEGLVDSMRRVGISIEATDDGLMIPSGVQRPEDGARWRTNGDHRVAMAGLLLTMSGADLVVEDPWVVCKSYPMLYRDARLAGWTITPRPPS